LKVSAVYSIGVLEGNCKNATGMLSENHQLLQSYYTGGSLFPADVSADSSKTVTSDQLSRSE